ncbi:MAG: AgmX/PglI C-terminal domain-containing protein, partial [Myxococcales bacterium]|nr:AgmX/PglI C-terminal domain-containing protein [Myxococcales bacterium]
PIAPDPPLVTTASRALSRAQIQRAMRAIMPAVRRCYDKYKLQGVALIQMQVLQSGRVTYARVKGKFLGTSMGTCIAEAARTARFPRFDGKPLKFIYPVILR